MRGRPDLRTRVANAVASLPGGRRLAEAYAFRTALVHVISYPKSGRTWFRFAIGSLMCDHFGMTPSSPSDLLEPHRLARLDRRVPALRFSHDAPYLTAQEHRARDRSRYRDKDVVLVTRDPRDVVVSSYYHHTTRAPAVGDPSFDGTLSEFVHDPVLGVESIVSFMNSWSAARKLPRRFLMVRYEDMSADLASVLRNAADFIGLDDVEDAAIARTSRASTFEKMSALERSDALDAGALRPADPSDPRSFKVRRGRVGGYVDELSPTDRSFVDAVARRLDPFFGYGDQDAPRAGTAPSL